MIKHAQGKKINLTMWKCNFEQGITRNYKALQMKGQEAMAKRRRRGIEGQCKGVEGRQWGVKVRLGVLKGGMEGSTGRRASVK